jgi:hypothetical protein
MRHLLFAVLLLNVSFSAFSMRAGRSHPCFERHEIASGHSLVLYQGRYFQLNKDENAHLDTLREDSDVAAYLKVLFPLVSPSVDSDLFPEMGIKLNIYGTTYCCSQVQSMDLYAHIRGHVLRTSILGAHDLFFLGRQVVATILGSRPVNNADVLHPVLEAYRNVCLTFGISLSQILHVSCQDGPNQGISQGEKPISDCFCAAVDPEKDLHLLPCEQQLIMSAWFGAYPFTSSLPQLVTLLEKLAVGGCLVLIDTLLYLGKEPHSEKVPLDCPPDDPPAHFLIQYFSDEDPWELPSGRFSVREFSDYRAFFVFFTELPHVGARLASLLVPFFCGGFMRCAPSFPDGSGHPAYQERRRASFVEQWNGNLLRAVHSALESNEFRVHLIEKLPPA